MSKRKLLFAILFLLTTIVIILVFIDIKTSKGVRIAWEVTQPHTILLNSHFEEIWSSSVYIACNTCLSAQNHAVYFSGAQKQNGLYALIKLDISTGQVEWEQPLIDRAVTSM